MNHIVGYSSEDTDKEAMGYGGMSVLEIRRQERCQGSRTLATDEANTETGFGTRRRVNVTGNVENDANNGQRANEDAEGGSSSE